MKQKGFAHLLLLLALPVIGLIGGFYYLINLKTPKIPSQNAIVAEAASESAKVSVQASQAIEPSPTPTPTPRPIILRKTYTNTAYAFAFTYPAVLTVQDDSEQDYSKRNGGDARENFRSYVKYEQGKVLLALSVLGRDSSFDNAIFTIWMFDNPNKLSPDSWFEKYWYYPFLWGMFYTPEKKLLEPVNEASVGGQVAKYAKVSYQQGSPKYFYISRKDKMYLIRILSSSEYTANDMLESFKFTD